MTQASSPTPTTQQPQDLVDAVVDIGASWARYGLSVGKLALQTSARTLETTAAVLGDLAKSFEQPAGSAAPTRDAAAATEPTHGADASPAKALEAASR